MAVSLLDPRLSPIGKSPPGSREFRKGTTGTPLLVSCLTALALAAAASSCTIVPVSEGVVGGIDLPPDLSVVLREGMREGEVIARFGAPPERTRIGQITTIVYTEVYQQRHQQLRLHETPVGSDARTRTRLHLVFLSDALRQAWVEVSGDGHDWETRWLLGGPKAVGGQQPPPPP